MSAAVLPQDWSEIQPHLDVALELEPDQRAGWLAQLASTQPAIAARVRELLQEHGAVAAAGFLSNPLFGSTQDVPPTLQRLLVERAALSPQAPGEGTQGLQPQALVGPYRLLSELGCGGMSSVWLAERSDGQPKRQVALKLPSSASRMHVERFARERDLLAALTHPQIARLYDAGISESGQPYLAMEYIAGTALLSSCDERRLSIRERLQLFLQVLGAVQFAHAQLIIHRDLKPSNILVTPQGRAVLLDFGIGKLLTAGIAHATQLTQLGGRALTPDYASPEQIAGQPLGIASDVYSLGVTLYELLTGVRPYRPKRASLGALEEAILTDELRRPSQSNLTEEAAATRGTHKRALQRALTGDLDTIVLKALKKQPAERYESVTAFAADIESHLHCLPVKARPDRLGYRVGRFIARHKLPVAAASTILCLLLGGAALAVWLARLATVERDRAAVERDRAVLLAARSEATTDFLNTVLMESANADKPITIRELRARSETLALSNTQDLPENRAAVLHMLASSYVAESDWESAARLVQSGLAALHRSSDQALKSALICGQAFISTHMGSPDTAMPKAIATIQAEVAKLQADPRTAAECLLELVQICSYACSPADRLRHTQEGLRRIGEIPGPKKHEPFMLASMGSVYADMERYAEAHAYFERAMRKFAANGAERTGPAMAVLANWAQEVADSGMPEPALAMYERKLRIDAERDPQASPSRVTLLNYARALHDAGRLEQSRAVFERLGRLDQKQSPDIVLHVSTLLGIAGLQLDTGEIEPAVQSLQRVDELRASDQTLARHLQQPRAVLAMRIALARRDFSAARAQAELMRPAQLTGRSGMSYHLRIADIELAAGNFAAAADHARLGLRLAITLRGGLPHTKQVGASWFRLGRAQLQLGEKDAARKAFQAAVLHLGQTVAPEHSMLVQARELAGS